MGAEAGGDTRKLYQQVAHAVASAIRSGEHPPGRRLPSERDLAEKFGVSRPTLREAMIALEIQGFVESRQGSGIFVTRTSPPLATFDLDIGAFELTEARMLIEAEAAALAAVSITDAEIAELENALVEMAHENAVAEEGERADRAFHVAIARATHNTALVSVVEMLWDQRYKSPLCMEMLARARRAGNQPRIEEHRRIIDALRGRDPRAARAAMREHLTRVIEGLLAATETDAVDKARAEVAAQRSSYAQRASV